ncbi:MAG: UDP-N-acetylmuramoylalanine--D-glutamate ligase [Candidatus Levybacteria bacterium RIFCSPLOWO2_12_FULL_37_14]|nr:MAG: UDP-N-acetylmuramoylalanine-D-glutamate ligase [Candidatus Levybacteria bacterium GW2011_GWA1_37_16]KKQ38055.1 MAG: UDP-N-acetylmuramoylalanine-D-glutamate ligase [Candidatus Levybacteria bacterium GW2011_GWC2_37_7]KKQ42885.1 MAG: UDP-N-acetylmuramoylalanine-D-glutamate ligase [Candidatus Levybacteria bacterium GW2011_GWB1_37_8]OGH51572.1 MAG: UDP-N-acetylmuramoylalanine--D-glutamate ligase [Candidatus Levybacteria bacterium RIFCSPLOWO2_12_FULL_37_14]
MKLANAESTLLGLKNKKILIVGKGIEGNAVYEYLIKHLPENKIDIVDQKDGVDYLSEQKEYDIAVKSPGVVPELITIPYTTATNIFMSNAKGKVIGITGTKGKSTTTTLIYEMMKAQDLDAYLGGNIGQSPLDFIDNLNDNSWTVLEMSSYQLNDLKVSPYIAVVLMITNEHLNYHKTQEAYIDAKRNILRFQNTQDTAIINKDYPASHESDIYTIAKIFRTSREREVGNGCFVNKQAIWMNRDGKTEKIINVEKIKLLGKHNLENVCASICVAKLAGVSNQNIAKVLEKFRGLEHRLEFVGEKNGVIFYNDSLATVPEAVIQALKTLPDTETLIAGGYDRGLDYSGIGEYLNKGQIKTLILFAPSGKRIWEEIRKATSEANRPEKFDVITMEQAVKIAAAETKPGKICLLSPASASFGTFKDYKDRGEQFKKAINEISNF